MTHVFPNGYRRVGDERSFEQKLLDLQNECFRRFDAMADAHAKALAAQSAVHAKAIAALRAEIAAERRAKDEAVNRLTPQLNAERRARGAAVSAVTTVHAADMQAERSARAEVVNELLTLSALAGISGYAADGFRPLLRPELLSAAALRYRDVMALRNHIANHFDGPSRPPPAFVCSHQTDER
jgi:hypothetical protein